MNRHRRGYWRPAFVCAVAFHVVLGLFAAFAGDLWGRLHPMPPVYTVRLFEVAEPSPPALKKAPKKAAVKRARKQAHRPRPKAVKRKSARKAERVKKRAKAAPKKVAKAKARSAERVVSLHPKRNAGKVKKTAQKKARTRSKKRRTVDGEALLARRLAALKEKVEEQRAEERLAQRLRELAARRSRSRGGGGGSGRQADQVLRLYLSKVYEEIRRHWILPESLLSSGGLEAVVVIRVLPDGRVAKWWFEHRSGLDLFDNSVKRAVDQAAPLPPLPKPLAHGPLEIGVRFRPGDVGVS